MAGEALFVARQLDHIKSEIYRREWPTYKCRQHFPVSFEGGSGCKSISHYMITSVGKAAIGLTFPLTTLKGKEFLTPVQPLTAQYAFNQLDVRMAMRTNINLRMEQALGARHAISELEDRLAYLGDEETGLIGAFTHPNIPIRVAEYSIETSTPEQGLRVINEAITQVGTLTKNTRMANMCLLPPRIYNYLSSTMVSVSAGGNSTMLQLLKQSHPNVFFDFCIRCEGAGIDGSDVIFAYERADDVLTLEIPNDFEQIDNPQGFNYQVDCLEEFGGIKYYHAAAVLTIGV